MQDILDRVIQVRTSDFHYVVSEHVRIAESFCESPIETLFLADILVLILLGGSRSCLSVCKHDAIEEPKKLSSIIVVPQYRWENYRIDFAFRNLELPKGILFVECDGHEFHERTAEQAERDRSRDRAIQASGIPILRFTGREIYRNSGSCISEVIHTIGRLGTPVSNG